MGAMGALEMYRRLYHELKPALDELGIGGPAASGVGDGSRRAGAGARRCHRGSRAEAEARKATAWLVLTEVGRELATFDSAMVAAAGRASPNSGPEGAPVAAKCRPAPLLPPHVPLPRSLPLALLLAFLCLPWPP
jgi:hypothetical protein